MDCNNKRLLLKVLNRTRGRSLITSARTFTCFKVLGIYALLGQILNQEIFEKLSSILCLFFKEELLVHLKHLGSLSSQIKFAVHDAHEIEISFGSFQNLGFFLWFQVFLKHLIGKILALSVS